MVVVTMTMKDSTIPSAQFSHMFQTGSLEDEYAELFEQDDVGAANSDEADVSD